MIAIAARRMGYRIHTLAPDTDSPTSHVADLEYSAAYDDIDTVKRFADGVDVITLEFENVLTETVDAATTYAPVRPGGHVLYTAQNRLREKTWLHGHNFPVAPFRHITSIEELRSGVEDLGTPAILKTAGFGYDGKGQVRIDTPDAVDDAYHELSGQEAVLETFIDFNREVSVVAARGLDGGFAHYGVVDNTHRNHILDVTISPADVSPTVYQEAIKITRGVLESLDVVGVMCVEFFLTRDDTLLINEIAPRVHNSGHFTIDACITSQFEQQVRAVCGLPLGSTAQPQPAAMANLLGDLWQNGEPNWPAMLAHTDVKLHLYGKKDARNARKMGHLTAMGDTSQAAAEKVMAARNALIMPTR
jgi:5-(carboxyamino)imidazole ribonucleotide synthase